MWEERVDAAVDYLLRTCLSKRGGSSGYVPDTATLPALEDTQRLKKRLAQTCDRIAKGGTLKLDD